MTIRIISLNIRHGGGAKGADLAHWLLRKAPSVIVLPEWRETNPGRLIRERLKASGFRTEASPRAIATINRVLMAAKDLATHQEITPPGSRAGDLRFIELTQGTRHPSSRVLFPSKECEGT